MLRIQNLSLSVVVCTRIFVLFWPIYDHIEAEYSRRLTCGWFMSNKSTDLRNSCGMTDLEKTMITREMVFGIHGQQKKISAPEDSFAKIISSLLLIYTYVWCAGLYRTTQTFLQQQWNLIIANLIWIFWYYLLHLKPPLKRSSFQKLHSNYN